MASAEKREKWRQASQRLRAQKIALDPEGWREHERLRVAEMLERNGPLTEDQRLERNEASRLGMQDLRARRAQPQAHAHGHATIGNVSTLRLDNTGVCVIEVYPSLLCNQMSEKVDLYIKLKLVIFSFI